ncbi:hypothetical protein B0T10DRAFT_515656 [Thelonectria olida]|uniref:Modin n=1 Tax=Thelonectria olida TaxID=1576542 RepID=A0A9P8W0W6_9HYPO|nr:hypothetical protein B0T10DRAFT_515656 [Thelonectria olida]
MSSDDNTELIIAVVALVISVLAFIIAILQALQQYFASATGFSSCSEEVIGKWSQFARRQMLWSEFRFEVQFEVPVIFVAKPENKRGPLGGDDDVTDPDRKIIRLDGSEGNFKYTSSIQEFDEQFRKSKQQVVHTADNEKATWYALLMAITRMEKESRVWQDKVSSECRATNGPPNDSSKGSSVSSDAPALPKHSMVVCMQRKRRTWDSMPDGLGKPYATTTISHLVEIAAMLGIYWRQFDLNNDKYRAQGNGFVLYGSYVDNLGITFTFQKQGPTWFEQNRVVPNYEVKKLCFGIATTIFYREKNVFADEPKDLGSLQLGSLSEIAQTLAVFGCDIHTVNFFRKNLDQARHSHIFPVAFELLGMVGKMLHVQDTVFRMIPNPTVFYWDPTSFSLPTLMGEFISSLKVLQSEECMKDSQHLDQILRWADEEKFSLVRASTSNLYDFGQKINGAKLINELNHLRAGIDVCDGYFNQMKFSMVRKVVCAHLQEVLNCLNEKDDNDASSKDHSKKDDPEQGEDDGQTTIHDIDSAFREDKESLLVEMYFSTIRQNVVRIVRKQDWMSKQIQARRPPGRKEEVTATKATPTEAVTERQVNEIWCTLVFRMLCWLQLHDFHKMDIQVSKSDAYASRIPVYIV